MLKLLLPLALTLLWKTTEGKKMVRRLELQGIKKTWNTYVDSCDEKSSCLNTRANGDYYQFYYDSDEDDKDMKIGIRFSVPGNVTEDQVSAIAFSTNIRTQEAASCFNWVIRDFTGSGNWVEPSNHKFDLQKNKWGHNTLYFHSKHFHKYISKDGNIDIKLTNSCQYGDDWALDYAGALVFLGDAGNEGRFIRNMKNHGIKARNNIKTDRSCESSNCLSKRSNSDYYAFSSKDDKNAMEIGIRFEMPRSPRVYSDQVSAFALNTNIYTEESSKCFHWYIRNYHTKKWIRPNHSKFHLKKGQWKNNVVYFESSQFENYVNTREGGYVEVKLRNHCEDDKWRISFATARVFLGYQDESD